VLVVVVVMLVIVVLAALVVAYAAYPHRGEELPAAPWLGDAVAKAADAVPVLEVEYAPEDDREEADQHREGSRPAL